MPALPCDTMRTLIARNAVKAVAATPGVSRIASPTRQTMACPPVRRTSAMRRSASTISVSRSVRSMVSDTATSEVDTTSTAVRIRSKTSKIAARKPCASSMRVDRTSMTVTPSLLAMDLTGGPDGGHEATMRVPSTSGFREFSTRTGTFPSIAGSIVRGCSTRAPKQASSDASANDSRGRRRASGTTDGSAVMTPSTSVQIWISSAPTPAPAMEALKSEPPRPSVDGRPSAVRAMNPPITATRPAAACGRTRRPSRSFVGPNRGAASVNRSSVTSTSRASTWTASMPRWRSSRVITTLEMRSPCERAASVSRGRVRPSPAASAASVRSSSSQWASTRVSRPAASATTGAAAASRSPRRAATRRRASASAPRAARSTAATRPSVVFPSADTTTTAPRRARAAINPATRVSASLVASELPPNFITIMPRPRLHPARRRTPRRLPPRADRIGREVSGRAPARPGGADPGEPAAGRRIGGGTRHR